MREGIKADCSGKPTGRLTVILDQLASQAAGPERLAAQLLQAGAVAEVEPRELELPEGMRIVVESRADAGEAVVCFDADQRCITSDLGSKVDPVALFLRNGCRHCNRGHLDDFHRSFFPGRSIPSRFWTAFAVNRRMSYTSIC